ncbi:alanine--glyoxylate aminotransferase 2, mitochondrial [Gastrophryne carolinensis]
MGLPGTMTGTLIKGHRKLFRALCANTEQLQKDWKANPTKELRKQADEANIQLNLALDEEVEKKLRWGKQKLYARANKPDTPLANKIQHFGPKQNVISLKTPEGTLTANPIKILKTFKNLLEYHKENLESEITVEEVIRAIKCFHTSKAPGPDGFTTLYYKKYAAELAPHLPIVSCRHSSTNEKLRMPPCDFQPEQYKGLPYEKVKNIRKTNLSASLTTYYKKPVLVHQGHMQWLFDQEGKRYLDLFAGIVTVSVGHCHPKVMEAAKKQMGRLWHTTNIYLHSPIHEYAEKLTSRLPGKLKVLFLTNSGSEANDLAFYMARLHTGNFDIISLRSGYHGASPYALGATAHTSYKPGVANGFGFHSTMCPDVYRGIWGGSHCRDSPVQTTRTCSCSPGSCEAKDRYIEQLKDTLQTSTGKKVAAFIAEPIMGMGGTIQYPKNFLKEAYELIRARGGLCIADEVQTGFGRTGSHYWGFQTHDLMPDIVTMAKGIGNGFPMAAVVTTEEIASSFAQALHFNTFGGNPIACSVGSAVLDVIEEDGLQNNCTVVGTHLLLELAKLRDKFEIVGDVRGKGLMIGVEMVKDKKTGHPLPAEEMNLIWEECKDNGVLLGKGGLNNNVFRIKPPMCITKEDVDFAVGVFEAALTKHQGTTAC